MNNDVVQEILLYLPVQSLFRFKAVSKSWRDVIDSPSFRELHTHIDDNSNNNNNSTVCLEFKFIRGQYRKLWIKLLDNGKAFTLPHNLDDLLPRSWNPNYVRFVGPVKGLICIYYAQAHFPIAICNPFLGQLKILPKSPFPQCEEEVDDREIGVGIGLDGDYKVVELVFCEEHDRYHARVYSGRTDSWRELPGDGVFDQMDRFIDKPLKSSSKNGYFAHWLVSDFVDSFVLTFDMRNEVFRETGLDPCGPTTEILAMDGDGEVSFLLFNTFGTLVQIYEPMSGLEYWTPMARVNLEEPSLWSGRDYVVLKDVHSNDRRRRREVSLYDYCAREFIGQFELGDSLGIMEYVGSFVSLE